MEPPQLEPLEIYRQRFPDAAYWRPYVQHVCSRHQLAPCQTLASNIPGTYPVFIVDERWVVKFFGRLFNGGTSFAAELDANQIITGNERIRAPRLLAHGSLLGPEADWSWPYLIFEYIPGVSLGKAYEEVTPNDRIALAAQLGLVTWHLHQSRLDGATALRPTWDAYTNMLRERYATYERRQREWRTLPDHLIAQIQDYLLPVDNLVDTTCTPRLLHGDITGDHVLGADVSGHWRMQGLIDFGDAIVGDPIFELLALHLLAFRGDKAMLGAYLDAYGTDRVLARRLPRIAMSLTLVHRYDNLGDLLRYYPKAAQVPTLDELSRLIWDIEVPGLPDLYGHYLLTGVDKV